ncbi:hypothetical protein DFA_01062 [Cavenderia fasciculata]|uniref:Saposin B-type domain-containing protein n=1 Tax=Cavenderia fasciculata TaxID=261658 RepID=F4PQM0_CACFS|nr:uncharacterized protein DFA_01062 [Cavenderia fasciculata]EGG21187.1 hypothetical protein DFA_01062 [Cavenderia fasciculata]|eukprot:XP_004359037.1 hypothetical protein DFA_01062 [Cavenderia fasciculata]
MKVLTIVSIVLVIFTIVTSVYSFTPVECDLCRLAIDELESMGTKDNITYDDMYGALERLCNSIPKYGSMCNTFLDYSGPLIIHQILNGTSSQSVCEEVQICTASQQQYLEKRANIKKGLEHMITIETASIRDTSTKGQAVYEMQKTNRINKKSRTVATFEAIKEEVTKNNIVVGAPNESFRNVVPVAAPIIDADEEQQDTVVIKNHQKRKLTTLDKKKHIEMLKSKLNF